MDSDDKELSKQVGQLQITVEKQLKVSIWELHITCTYIFTVSFDLIQEIKAEIEQYKAELEQKDAMIQIHGDESSTDMQSKDNLQKSERKHEKMVCNS